MPAKSEKQRRFMAAVANNPKFAKKVGVPQSVGKEFTMNKYAQGGAMRPKPRPGVMDAPRPKPRPKDVEKSRGRMMVEEAMRRGDKRGVVEEPITRGLDERGEMMSGYKRGGKVKKMASGGSCGTKMYAKGGKVRGDGVCSKGHTKGRMI